MESGSARAFRINFGLQAILAVATVGGFVFAAAAKPPAWVWVVAAVLAVGLIVMQVFTYRSGAHDRLFRFANEDDQKFIDFFAKWYEGGGKHYIFCKDLAWLTPTSRARIAATLRQRGRDVSVFVSEDDADVCAELRAAGCRVVRVPSALAEIRVKMSLHIKDNDDHTMIFQQKRPNATDVRFEQTEDPNDTALAATLVKALELLTADRPSNGEYTSVS